MRIRWTIWKDQFAEKIQLKHGVCIEEVEDILKSKAHFRKAAKGQVRGEDVYAAYGQTTVGRYIIVLFIFKRPDGALPISARDMSHSEKRYYEKKRQKN
ncbi:MAG: BrnT family toxin [Candidatus Aminicenantes bacterium]|nr:BrnT family toxin [Candidatus Aminicenantes bacterium]